MAIEAAKAASNNRLYTATPSQMMKNAQLANHILGGIHLTEEIVLDVSLTGT